ncbi:hypothetical protein Scep_020648 [Stephania cephalantha]|uniref:U1 small nuclear ribonucleoprotein 70 kDa n=1 Tax=Stephania cephalantha TaxID=152367 RepID=A0AAP0ICY7_9MAGN
MQTSFQPFDPQKVQRRARIHQLRLEEGAKKAAEEFEKYDPASDPNISGDPYKTLFVARLNYETTEHRIKREFEGYGPIKKVGVLDNTQGDQVRIVTDKVTNKPRGYAFVEYMHTRDMKAAYKQADGRKLDNRRVLVDVERGRTVPNWRPRRLGGGLGSTRVGGEDLNQKYSGREPQQGGTARSEEPRTRDDRHVDREREKSRERGRDKDREREKSRERSHDRTRDREPREERHHRERDRHRDREKDRDRDHGRDRDRERDRERGRDHDRGRDKERERDRGRERDRDRGRDRPRDRDRNYEHGEIEEDRGRSRDREADYDRVESKHGLDRHDERAGEYDQFEHGRGYELPEPEGDHYSHRRYDNLEPHGDLGQYDQDEGRDHDRYDQMEPEDYQHDRATSESHEKERTRNHEWDYQRSERSLSHEYER